MEFRGVFVPLVTPFTADGDVAAGALAELAQGVLDDGAAGLVALGTTGEAAALGDQERRQVIDVCARVCAERGAGLVVGAGGGDTRAVGRALAELAAWRQVGAALVSVPPFIRPGVDGVRSHVARLAQDSPVPLVLYHVPHRSGQELTAATLRSLGEHPRVVGVKYAVDGVDEDAVELLADLPAGFGVLAGADLFLVPMLALGAAGGILASAHVCTSQFCELVAAWQRGEVQRVAGLGHRLARLSAALFAAPNPTVLKAVLHAQGRIPTPAVRLPLVPADPAQVELALARQHDVAAGACRPT